MEFSDRELVVSQNSDNDDDDDRNDDSDGDDDDDDKDAVAVDLVHVTAGLVPVEALQVDEPLAGKQNVHLGTLFSLAPFSLFSSSKV